MPRNLVTTRLEKFFYTRGLDKKTKKEVQQRVLDVIAFQQTHEKDFKQVNMFTLTGTDFSGKTSVVIRIVSALRQEGFRIFPLRGSGTTGIPELLSIPDNPQELIVDLQTVATMQRQYMTAALAYRTSPTPETGTNFLKAAISMQYEMFRQIRYWSQYGLVIADRAGFDALLGGHERGGGIGFLERELSQIQPVPYGISAWIDVPLREIRRRRKKDPQKMDQNTEAELQARRYGYQQLWVQSEQGNLLPGQRLVRINGQQNIQTVTQTTLAVLEQCVHQGCCRLEK